MDILPIQPNLAPNHSIYIHIPFCRQRCTYCDFNTVAGQINLIPEYVKALCTEIVKVSNLFTTPVPIHTIFFGGGTPSILSAAHIESIINTITKHFSILPQAEITMEANPGTVSLSSLTAYHNAGVNRLSFGVQSIHPDELALLGRIHTHEITIESIEFARLAGFDNLNLDLIFGLPNQTLKSWQETLAGILELKPEHLSLYALKLEEGTPLYRSVASNLVATPDDDLAADMFEFAMDFLPQFQFQHYEISNWAKVSPQGALSSRHNLQYWKNLPYFGFGAGAHGLINNTRLINEYDINRYIKACQTQTPFQAPIGPATIEAHQRSSVEDLEDEIILALRLVSDGVNIDAVNQKFGINFHKKYHSVLTQLDGYGLIDWSDNENILRLTRKGCLLGNQVFQEFLED